MKIKLHIMKKTIPLTFAAGTLLLVGCCTTPHTTTGAIAPKVHAPNWLANGLIAFYPFNGNANDASGHGYNGTAHNASTVPDHLSNPDSAYRLNGTDAYIYFGPVLPDMQTITVTAWVNSSGGGTFFADADWQIDNDFTIALGTSNTVVRCDKSPAPPTPGFGYAIPLDTQIEGVWRNMAWVVRTNLVQVYVDGDLKGFVNIKGAGNVGYHDFIIGTEEYPQGTMGWDGWWGGDVSNLRIYNRALSADEVRQLYAYESQSSPHLEKAKIVPPKKAVVTKWEYKVTKIGANLVSAKGLVSEETINRMAEQGWHLVSFLTVVKTHLFSCLRDTNNAPIRVENRPTSRCTRTAAMR